MSLQKPASNHGHTKPSELEDALKIANAVQTDATLSFLKACSVTDLSVAQQSNQLFLMGHTEFGQVQLTAMHPHQTATEVRQAVYSQLEHWAETAPKIQQEEGIKRLGAEAKHSLHILLGVEPYSESSLVKLLGLQGCADELPASTTLDNEWLADTLEQEGYNSSSLSVTSIEIHANKWILQREAIWSIIDSHKERGYYVALQEQANNPMHLTLITCKPHCIEDIAALDSTSYEQRYNTFPAAKGSAYVPDEFFENLLLSEHEYERKKRLAMDFEVLERIMDEALFKDTKRPPHVLFCREEHLPDTAIADMAGEVHRSETRIDDPDAIHELHEGVAELIKSRADFIYIVLVPHSTEYLMAEVHYVPHGEYAEEYTPSY